MSRSGRRYDPSRDIPDQSGRVFLITGGTGGLGAVIVKNLALHNPQHIFFTGRNEANASAVIASTHASHPDLSVTYIPCDHASLASVRDAATNFLAQSSRLDVLICNAGIMGSETGLSKDGYEVQFAVNHLSHALLVKLLLPTLLETAHGDNDVAAGRDVRIITTTSAAAVTAPATGIDFATLNTPQASLGSLLNGGSRWCRYGQSKLANLLYSDSLAQHYPDLCCVAVHPGAVLTAGFNALPLAQRLPVMVHSFGRFMEEGHGSYGQLWAATAPRAEGDGDGVRSGAYYEPVGKIGHRKTRWMRDGELAMRLWEWTAEQLKGWEP